MKVVTLLAQKGGAGKTTLALHWAVEAERNPAGLVRKKQLRVALIDIDPQGSSASWYRKREAETPILVQTDAVGLVTALEAARADDFDLVLIDTAPHAEAPAVAAARVADLIVIPTRPSVLDLEAIGASVAIIQAVRKPAAIVLNACPPRSTVTEEARSALHAYGVPICPTPIFQRLAMSQAFNDGRAVVEIEPKGKAAGEISATWEWLAERMKGG